MLADIFWYNKWRISVSYALLLIEFCTFAMLPFLMGRAVDSIIENDRKDFTIWVSVSAFALIAGFVRRRFDNRAFLKIWAQEATRVITSLIVRNVDRTKIISRSYMVKEFANFLEFTIPSAVSAVVDIIVSLVMLWIFVPHIGMTMLVLLLAAVGACYVFSIYINELEITCQHGREKIADAIMVDDTLAVEKGYENQRRSLVKYCDLDACNWSIIDVIATIAIIVVILSMASAGCTAGAIMANLVYCQKLFEKSCFISNFFKHYKQMKVCKDFLNEK